MKQLFFKLFFPKSRHSRKLTPISLTTAELLQNHLNSCYSLEDTSRLKAILRLMIEDFSPGDDVILSLNINSRELQIRYCNSYLNKKRYPVSDIYRKFQEAESLMEIDAIMLHCKMNADYYTSNYGDLTPLQSITIFKQMHLKRNQAIMHEYNLKNNGKC